MSGIYISDVEMPTGCSALTLKVWSDGQVEIIDTDGEWKTSEAIPVPPHGDLKDADAIRKDWLDNYRYALTRSILDSFDNAPTIIPADPVSENETHLESEGLI